MRRVLRVAASADENDPIVHFSCVLSFASASVSTQPRPLSCQVRPGSRRIRGECEVIWPMTSAGMGGSRGRGLAAAALGRGAQPTDLSGGRLASGPPDRSSFKPDDMRTVT